MDLSHVLVSKWIDVFAVAVQKSPEPDLSEDLDDNHDKTITRSRLVGWAARSIMLLLTGGRKCC